MSTPIINGTATGTFSSGTSGSTGTLSPTGTNNIICVFVGYEANSATASAVSNITATGLSFTKRKAINTTGDPTFQTGGLEFWWAPAAASFSGAISVTLTHTIDDAAIIAFGVSGAFSLVSPFDTNVSLPAASSALSANDAVNPTFSTSQAHSLAFMAGFCGITVPTWTVSAPWTNGPSAVNGGGTHFGVVDSAYDGFSSTQSNITANVTHGDVNYLIVDAITGDAGASTETGTATLAFGGPKFAAGGSRTETGTATLAFGGLKFVAGGSRTETGTATLAFGGPKFLAAGSREETGAVTLAFSGFAIRALGADTGTTPSAVNSAVSTKLTGGVQPLFWNVPIVIPSSGNPSPEFQLKWNSTVKVLEQQININGTIVPKSYIDKQDANTLSAAQTFAQSYVNSRIANNIYAPCPVSALPATAAQGDRGMATNSNQTTTAGIGTPVAGGGSNAVPVYFTGGTWLIG